MGQPDTVTAHITARLVVGIAVAGIAVLALLADGACVSAQDAPLAVTDDFETPTLDLDIWNTVQIEADRYGIEGTVVRRGHGALAITVEPSDRACDGTCQRNEIRIANHLRLRFGQGAWYGFSFQVRGDFDPPTLPRWVIGQWKEESDASPFLAQRYSGGVFHITAQDDDCRVLIARSGSTPHEFLSTLSAGRYDDFTFLTDTRDYMCSSEIEIEHAADPILPDPRGAWVDMAYFVRGGRDGGGLVEVWANGRFIARVKGSIGSDRVFGPTQYFKIGVYRDPMPGNATVYFDSFRRGASRQDVDPAR